MAIEVQDPRGLTFTRWAGEMTRLNGDYPLPMSERFWKGWARAVFQTTASVPNPDRFVNWDEWALAWKRSI